MKKIASSIVELLRATPIWLFWITVILSMTTGLFIFKAIEATLFFGWAPSLALDLQQRYPLTLKHRSPRWFAACAAFFTAALILAYVYPNIENNLLVLPAFACFVAAIAFLSGTISRLEIHARTAKPEELGRNTFGTFIALFYWPLGGAFNVNKRLSAVEAALLRK